MLKPTFALLALAAGASAHLAAWHKAMWCLNGPQNQEDLNSYAIVSPLYQLPFKDWWFHHVNGCDEYPPAPGAFLDLPAGGSFMVEIASNRAKTTLSYNGRDTSAWPDGATYPEDYTVPGCITSPNMHAQFHGKAAGTAFAISYNSDIKQVTPENLVVFSVRYMTPWKREVWYDVPADMPACPPEGCICAWGWVPNGCGQPNMYHQAFRCRVTNSKSNTPLAKPKAPVWCEGDESKCVKGAKQMVYWNQQEGNNVFVDGRSRVGELKSPGYNMVMGFRDGAQNDIFAGAPSGGSPPPAPAPAPAPSQSKPAPAPSQSNGGGAKVTTAASPAPSSPAPSSAPPASNGGGSSTPPSSGGSTPPPSSGVSTPPQDNNTTPPADGTTTPPPTQANEEPPKSFTTKAIRKCKRGKARRGLGALSEAPGSVENVVRGVHAHAKKRHGSTF